MPGERDDTLRAYRDKRDPARTTEPFDGPRAGGAATYRGDFVVHLHDASRSHYDLRLQVGDVLKSFAVPKGPTLDPAEKRLAVQTEDHPLAYLDFEDVIPDGNYGAGAMIVWDTGRVVYLDGSAEEGLERGKVDFTLAGHKLRGRFALIETGRRKAPPVAGGTGRRRGPDKKQPTQWLLVKKPDAFANAGRDVVAEEPHSVLSGLRVDQLPAASAIAAELSERAERLGAPLGDIDTAHLSPMLCALSGGALQDKERLYELKLDGVRILADKRGDRVELYYRKHRLATASYPEVVRAVRAIAPERAVLDGEVVAFDEEGRPSFQRLGRRIHLVRPHDVRRVAAEVPVVYLVFDLLALGDRDLRGLPLVARKELLQRLLPGKGLVRVLDHLEGDGRPLMTFCEQNRLEGVVGKRRSSVYQPGPKRLDDWVKFKCHRDNDFVVVGWQRGKGSRKLGALLLATYDDDDELVLRGKVGSGFDDNTLDELLERLLAMEIDTCPAKGSVTVKGPHRFVRPELVATVQHLGWSDSGTPRFPVFKGLRPDVSPADCRASGPAEREPAQAMAAAAQDTTAEGGQPRLRAANVAHKAVLTNQGKVFWPDEGYTKGDLCDYYASVAGVMLPFLRDRPIVLVRYPDGIAGKSFFQWHVPKGTPPWIRTLTVREEGERGKTEKNTFVVDDVDGLLHIANLGCIPIHILAKRAGHLLDLDFLTVDFDIGEQPFRHAVVLARTLHGLLGELGLTGYPKTSGQSGLHVLVPLGPGVAFQVARVLVELLGRLLLLRHGDIATMERVVDRRGARVYIDVGQTGRSRTIVAPYSVRAVRGATVSTPLSWDEVHLALDPSRFTMFTVVDRIVALGDPMAAMLEDRPDIAGAVARLETMLRAGS